MYRQKTNYPYISFCSNEATKAIITYLNYRLKKNPDLCEDENLFDVKTITVQAHFRRINDKLNLGQTGQYRFFHAHALRKYFATQLLKADLDSMTIDFLSGRSINKTREAYFKADPEKLKNKYREVVNSLIIRDEYMFKSSNEKIESIYIHNKNYLT